MPRYRSRSKTRAAKEKKRIRAQVPRDRRKLGHWAVRGTHKDYENLRGHARRLAEKDVPSYVSKAALNLLQDADRGKMMKAVHSHENHWFTDGLAWLLDKVPRGIGFDWLRGLGEAGLKPFRGDELTEVDAQYARLVNEAYKDPAERDARFEHWEHQKEFDGNYVTVYDNEDGHRFVAVRGTKMNLKDLGQDLAIGVQGRPQNLIGAELKHVLDNTEPGRTVDVGGHSLGTSLILTAFDNDDSLQNRVHQTYLYNPAISPFTNKNVTQNYEGDERVRYFIDLLDPVSIGDIGEMGPTNVVYRTSYKNPLKAHQLEQWGGANGGLLEHDDAQLENEHLLTHKRTELPYDTTGDGIPNSPEVGEAGEVGDEMAQEFTLDFGNEFDGGAWNVYWNQ